MSRVIRCPMETAKGTWHLHQGIGLEQWVPSPSNNANGQGTGVQGDSSCEDTIL